jgi:translation initiation factor 2 beta subunit (eIF-2beta)/eIF-5
MSPTSYISQAIVDFMPGKKYSFGQQSLMKAIEPGQKALIKFLDQPKVVDTEWGEKFSVTILLLSHPLYSIPSPEGIKMGWQTSAKVLKDIVNLLKEEKEFEKDYLSMTWELSVAEDGSYWLNA